MNDVKPLRPAACAGDSLPGMVSIRHPVEVLIESTLAGSADRIKYCIRAAEQSFAGFDEGALAYPGQDRDAEKQWTSILGWIAPNDVESLMAWCSAAPMRVLMLGAAHPAMEIAALYGIPVPRALALLRGAYVYLYEKEHSWRAALFWSPPRWLSNDVAYRLLWEAEQRFGIAAKQLTTSDVGYEQARAASAVKPELRLHELLKSFAF